MKVAVIKRRPVTLLQWKTLAFAQGWKCKQCHDPLSPTAQVDHCIPLFRGGVDTIENMQILCCSCHAKKTQEERMVQTRSTSYVVCKDCQRIHSPFFLHEHLRGRCLGKRSRSQQRGKAASPLSRNT